MPLLGDLLNQAKDAIAGKTEDLANQAINSIKDDAREAADKLKRKAKEALDNVNRTYVFDELPKNLEELKSWKHFDMSSSFCVAAMTVAALCRYSESKEDCFGMLDFLNGPTDLSESDRQFLEDRFMDGRSYVPFSYFDGTEPENDYRPKVPYRITVTQTPYSQDAGENYLTLYLRSSGADSPRPVTLRLKPSTHEWFLWNLESLLADIRIPVSKDPWA